MSRTYTATRGLICHAEDDEGKSVSFALRYTFTVYPAREATLTEPAEEADVTVTKTRVESFLRGSWRDSDIEALAWVVFGGDDAMRDWLLAEAAEQAMAMADDAADHKRQMRAEDAA